MPVPSSVQLSDILIAGARLSALVRPTPLQYNKRLSQKYGANIYIKREDQQEVRSFKIRGAYNKLLSLSEAEKGKGVVSASAGNHAQGVAYGCQALGIQGTIFMPKGTPNQKVRKVKHFGGEMVEVRLEGNNFDEAKEASLALCKNEDRVYVHPFDDPFTIAGQGTIAKEIFDHADFKPDYILASVGGGGMVAGIGIYSKQVSPETQLIAVEAQGQESMKESLALGKPTTLEDINTFAEGTAVKTPGDLSFSIAREVIDRNVVVEIGHVCSEMIDLYQNEGIVVEPSGALPFAGLEHIRGDIRGKNVVCVICGGNNDILRYPEIMEKSLIWQGLKHHFIINFSQRPGELKRLVNDVLTEDEDIVMFEYIKKNNREKGPALIAIELSRAEDLEGLLERFQAHHIDHQRIDPEDEFYSILL